MPPRDRITSFASPAPGATQGRTDQGVDWSNVRSIAAVASGTITNVYSRLSGFGQTIIERLNTGESIYYAEETAGTRTEVTPGQSVTAGQEIAGGGSGGVIEAGFWDPSTGRSAGAPGYAEGQATAAGRAFLARIRGGNVPDLTIPTYVPRAYRSWVSSAAQGTGIPAPIVAAQINDESGFDPTATSPTNAEGIAQFEVPTFRQYGKGDPYNPQDALGAYINYMNTLLSQYNGNIRNALAAYNAGSANIAAGYGYADAILAKAGFPRTATAGSSSSYGGTRPGGQSTGQDDAAINKVFSDYEAELNTPRTAPASTFTPPAVAGWSAPFQWWWQSFSGAYAQDQAQP